MTAGFFIGESATMDVIILLVERARHFFIIISSAQ